MDPQASLSRRVFRQPDKQGLFYEALTNRIEFPVVQLSETLSLTPSSIHLAKGESQFLSLPAREYLLEKSLRQTLLADDTLVLIDCPPSLGVLTFNCLTAADLCVRVVRATRQIQLINWFVPATAVLSYKQPSLLRLLLRIQEFKLGVRDSAKVSVLLRQFRSVGVAHNLQQPIAGIYLSTQHLPQITLFCTEHLLCHWLVA
jgi:hypothetical protein